MLGQPDAGRHIEPAADALELPGLHQARERGARRPFGYVARTERALSFRREGQGSPCRHILISTNVL
jgi:hypothetical protein